MGRKATGGKLGREDVKRFLQQYQMAKQEKRILEERRRALSYVLEITEVEERIAKQQAEMANAIQNVMDLIELLPAGSMERTVVALRHIDSEAWEEIAKNVHMSRSRVIDYYNAALDALASHARAKELVNR